MDERLNEIQARCDAATGKKWIRKNGQILLQLGSGDLLKIGGGFDENDAEFVSHSLEDIYWLLTQIERMNKKGMWIDHKYGIKCSKCNRSLDLQYIDGVPVSWLEYCPNCGTEME